MHIPDGLLSVPVAMGYGLSSIVGIGVACRQLRSRGARGSSALLGVCAAFIFAAQTVNFPVGAGTSGHLIGSTLGVALLGLPGALIAMTAVLFVQCFVFGDGGVFALGANVFNLALVGCVVGYSCYHLLCGARPSPTRRVAAVAFASWCATVAAAASCAEQLALSGTARGAIVFLAMLGVHALIGVGEAVITALVIASVLRFRPDLLEEFGSRAASPTRASSAAWAGLGLSLAVAALLAPFASASPDGLSRVVQSLRLQGHEPALLAEFSGLVLGKGLWVTVLAGCGGTLLLYGLSWLLARALVPRAVLGEPVASRAAAESSG